VVTAVEVAPLVQAGRLGTVVAAVVVAASAEAVTGRVPVRRSELVNLV
jgi:hypothetical protein